MSEPTRTVAAPPPEKGDTCEFDRATAYWLAQVARLAYEEPPAIDHALGPHGFDPVRFFRRSETEAFLAVRHGRDDEPTRAVLAFRGTERDFVDIFTDIRFFMRRTSDGRFRVHEGFLAAIDAVWEEVLAAMEPLPQDAKLFFTGHSLGGALATLAAHRRQPTALYTFGSPRVAGGKLAAHLNGATTAYRVVNSQDIVTAIPIWGYRHVGHTVFLDDEGRVVCPAPRMGMLQRFLWLLTTSLLYAGGLVAATRLHKMLTDHRVSDYESKLAGDPSPPNSP